MPQLQHGRHAFFAWLKMSELAQLAHLLSMLDDLILYEIAERGDPLGLAQFFRIGQKYRDLGAFQIRKDADQVRKILGDVIGQNAYSEIVDHALQNTEIVVNGQKRTDLLCHQVLHQRCACLHLI